MFLLFLVTVLQSQVTNALSVKVTCQAAVPERLEDARAVCREDPSHHCCVRVPAGLGPGSGPRGWVSEAPGALCGPALGRR